MGKRFSFASARFLAAACVLAALAVAAGWLYADAHRAPSCSWPLRIRGPATPQQVGLVRCYLQAVAERDTGEMNAVAANIPPFRAVRADFRYSGDARAGVAVAIFTLNPVDSTYVYLTIRFADGAVDEGEGVINMASMGGPTVWRMDIGP